MQEYKFWLTFTNRNTFYFEATPMIFFIITIGSVLYVDFNFDIDFLLRLQKLNFNLVCNFVTLVDAKSFFISFRPGN